MNRHLKRNNKLFINNKGEANEAMQRENRSFGFDFFMYKKSDIKLLKCMSTGNGHEAAHCTAKAQTIV